MKKLIMAFAAGIALAASSAFAEDSKGSLKIGEEAWSNDRVVEWKDDGFALKDREYGAIETKARLIYSPKLKLALKVAKLSEGDYTVQIQAFDKKGSYLGHVDLAKNNSILGELSFPFANYKEAIPAGTDSFSVKIWLAGPLGSSIAIENVRCE